MKKIMLLMILVLFVFISMPVFGAESPSSWAKDWVADAIERGFVPEHLQGDYQAAITREEFAELFVTAVFADVNNATSKMSDYKQSDWYFDTLTPENFLSRVSTTEYFTDTDNDYVTTANILGMVNGIGDHLYDPDGLITREQAAAMFVNYFQTVDYGNGGTEARTQLSDLGAVSDWAYEAVCWVYGAGYLEGVKEAVLDEYGNTVAYGRFDPQGTFTREQAITIISKIGPGPSNYNVLNNLIIRGYLKIDLDVLMVGMEVDGDTIRIVNSGYDAPFSAIKETLWGMTRYKDYAEKYKTCELVAATLVPNGAQFEPFDAAFLDRVLLGKEVVYDYTVFSIAYNKGPYLTVYEKNPGYGYYTYVGGVLFYYDHGVRLVVSGKQID